MRRISGHISFYFATVLILALLLAVCLGAGPCLADNWTKTADGGLEGHYSQIEDAVTATTFFGSVLYAGTEDATNGCQVWTYSGGQWTKMRSGGFGDKNNIVVKSMCVYNSKLYVGTGKNGLGGCEIWSFDGAIWAQVNADGFGDAHNNAAAALAVFGSSLYAGTNNATGGGEVWKYDGTTWTRVAVHGFSDANNLSVNSLCAYGANLFAGTYNNITGCVIWKYDGSSWSQSVGQAPDGTIGTGPGFGGGYENAGVSVMAVYNSKLYAGLTTLWDSNIWASSLLVPKDWVRKVWSFDGTNWTAVTSAGVGGNAGYGGPNWGNGTLQDSATSICLYGSSLVIGSTNQAQGCQVWSFDGSAWTQLNTTGFGDPFNYTTTALAASGPNLFAGTSNGRNGSEVWWYNGRWARISKFGFAENNNFSVSEMASLGGTLYAGTCSNNVAELWGNNGSGWSFKTLVGAGDKNNLQVSSMAVFNSKLYLGTKNETGGGEVWVYDSGVPTQVYDSGFASDTMDDVPSMAVYGGQLFAGTHNVAPLTWWPGCEVWKYNGATWTRDGVTGFGDSNNISATSMCVYGDSLYVGTANSVTGCEIWKRDPLGGWAQVNKDVFGPAKSVTATSMAVYNGDLYVGVDGAGGQVWRYNGSTWAKVGSDGLRNPSNQGVLSLAVLGDTLYAGTLNGSGCEILRYSGSGDWVKTAGGGLGEPQNTGAASLAAFGSKIWAGTTNQENGAQVWSSLGPPGSIQSVNPQKGSHGQTLDVAITGVGTHFANGTSQATFSGAGIKVNGTTVSDATHASANITIAGDAATGARDVNVVTGQDTPAPLAGSFAVLDLRITAVSPTSVNQGETRDINITGTDTNFGGGSIATFSGPGITVHSTTVTDATHARANITLAADAQPGARDVNVVTAGVTTDPLKDGLTVHGAPPRLDSVNPTYGRVGDSVTLTGKWFGTDQLSSVVKFHGKLATTVTAWSDGSIQCKVPVGATTGPVVVTTSEGTSAGKPFQVVNTIPGGNVTVDAGNGVTVTFDHVTSPGNTRALSANDPSVDGYTIPHGLTRDITTDAGYSGNVTVTMSYAAQTLFRYQEQALAMLHENGSNWVDVTTGRDATQKTVTGQVTSLSRFTLAIPVSAQLPATATWYLAEGSTAWGFSTYITIENPNNRWVTARVTYMTSSGGVVSRPDIPLPPMSQTTLNPAADLGSKDFSTKVECLQAEIIAVDRTMTWTGPGAASPEGHSSIGVPGSDTRWYFPEGSSKWGFETWMLVQNPNSVEAHCTLTYMIEGVGQKSVSKTVAPNSRGSFFMADDIGSADASIEVTSDQPVIPERSMYRNNRREGSNSIGASSKEHSKNYFLAEGTTGWGFTTYVLVQNPNDTANRVTVTYMTNDGPKAMEPFDMAANSRKTIRVNDVLPNVDFSTKVTGTKPLIAERAMYWGANTPLGEACHDSIGVAGPHRVWYLPDGQTTIGWETWTLIQNPNASPVTVEISYLTPSGQGDIVFTDTIPANSRKTYNMGSRIMNQRAAALVKSKTSGKGIIVERSMYWNNRGVGTCTIGGYSD